MLNTPCRKRICHPLRVHCVLAIVVSAQPDMWLQALDPQDEER